MKLDAFLELENTSGPKTRLESFHFETNKISEHDDRQPENRTSCHECNFLLERTIPVLFELKSSPAFSPDIFLKIVTLSVIPDEKNG
jgi:hypothetical protein